MDPDQRFGNSASDSRRLPPPTVSHRLDALATAATQQYPIKASAFYRHAGAQGQDPLSAGIQAVGRELPETILPLLRTPFSKDAANVADPSRKTPDMRPTLPPIGTIRDVGREMSRELTQQQYLSPVSIHSPPMTHPRESENPAGTSIGSIEPEFKTSFQFVVNEDAKEARKTVRKHVMREYRRRERWEQGSQKPPRERKASTASQNKRRRKPSMSPINSESPMSESLVETSFVSSPRVIDLDEASDSTTMVISNKRRRLSPASEYAGLMFGTTIPDNDTMFDEPNSDEDLPYRADPWAAVAKTQVDPFSKVEFDCGPASQALLHHFAWVMPSVMDEQVAGTVFHRLGWLYSMVAIHDPNPVHVILGFTLAHMAQCHGREEPALAIEHKQKALQLINGRMADPDEAVSNDAIGGVVNIAALELASCNPAGFAVHMAGLHRMITGRGGIDTLSRNSDLEDVLIRLDVLRAYIAISAPRYPFYAIIRNLHPLALNIPPQPAIQAPDGFNHNGPSFFSPNLLVYRYCEDVLLIVHDLEDLMLLIRTAATAAPSSDTEASSLRELFSSTMSQLLRNTSPYPRRYLLDLSRKCLRLAALIFIDIAMQEIFDNPPRRGFFAHKLKTRFLDTSAPWGRSLEMLVAVLLQSDRMTLEKPWRGWYVADAITLTMGLVDGSWQAIETVLTAYLRERMAAMKNDEGARKSKDVFDLKGMVNRVAEDWN